MKHKVKVTVIDKKIYPELQEKYCADPKAGMCPCYNVGDEFIFERDEENLRCLQWWGMRLPARLTRKLTEICRLCV